MATWYYHVSELIDLHSVPMEIQTVMWTQWIHLYGYNNRVAYATATCMTNTRSLILAELAGIRAYVIFLEEGLDRVADYSSASITSGNCGNY